MAKDRHGRGWQRGSLWNEEGAGQSTQRESSPRALPSSPSSPHPGPIREYVPGKQAQDREAAFIIQGLRGQGTLRWGRNRQLRVLSLSPSGLLWPGAESGPPASWETPSPISLTHVPTEPAGVTMPSPQAGPSGRKHCLCGRGLPSILPGLEPGGGIGLLELGERDITEEADPLAAG